MNEWGRSQSYAPEMHERDKAVEFSKWKLFVETIGLIG